MKMRLFHLSFTAVMLRFYLMMAIILIAGYAGIWPLAFLALPVFMSCLMGTEITFGRQPVKEARSQEAVKHQMKKQEKAHAQHAA